MSVPRVNFAQLTNPDISVQYSRGSRRRASQLQEFVILLHQQAKEAFEPLYAAQLWVVNASDWKRLYRYPYGLPFTRLSSRPPCIVVSATYPERLLKRFDTICLQAVQKGATIRQGQLQEFLDLLIGHEWGHVIAHQHKLRTYVRWLDELMATYIFIAALAETSPGLLERFVQWGKVSEEGAALPMHDLGRFEYPGRSKLSFEGSVWFQGVFIGRAAALQPQWGWEFPRAFGKELAALPRTRNRVARGDVTRVLLGLEPSFKSWFGAFGLPET